MLQIKIKIVDIGIDGHFVLPFEVSPHLPEFRVSAASRHDIVHDINVNVVKYHNVTIRCRASDIIDYVSKDNTILRRCHLK